MKKQKINSNINLETLAGGAFAEKVNEALMQVAENIQNQNTDATAKRGISVNIKFTPNKTRQLVSTSISVTTKLAATEAIDTQMIMGRNMRTGVIEIAEYDGQITGQTALDFDQADEAEAPEPNGKPLDLRNRGGMDSNALASVAASDLVPGRDFDPATGEIYEAAAQPSSNNVVPLKKVAAEA